MRRSRAPSNWPGSFFAARSWAGCTTNMFGFDLRQAQYLTAPIVGAIVAAILHTGLARLAQEGTAAEPGRAAQTPAE